MNNSEYTSGRPEDMFIEYYTPRDYRYISRYYTTNIINDEHGIHHESSKDCTIEKSDNDVYHLVDTKSENRIDIISTIYYGNPMNWWIICKANKIIDPFNIPLGTVLRIPPVKSIYSEKGGL